MLENDFNMIAHNPPPCWAKGGNLELTGTADKCDASESRGGGKKNADFFCGEIGTAPASTRRISENRASNDSPSRILQGDVLGSL